MKAKYLNNLMDHLDNFNAGSIPSLLIRKICYDSRKVNHDSLFVAISGYTVDGHDFLESARKAGAIAAVVERSDPAVSIPQYIVKNTRQALAQIAYAFYQPEISNLRLVGITGTNGKTTTSYLIRSVLNAAGLTSGLIGTIAYDTGKDIRPARHTTPESVDLFELLYQMSLNDLKGCVLEVSSHALELNRIDNLPLEVAVFTNLTQDHLDFHPDMQTYFKVKSKLFDHLIAGGHAVINADDPYGKQLIEKLDTPQLTYSLEDIADVCAVSWDSSLNGITVRLKMAWGEIDIESPLIGEFNLQNIMAAVASGLALNFDLKTIKQGIETVASVPGRLEPVSVSSGLKVIVDYAHTPDALQKSLHVLQKLSSGKLWVVFGCGGDRDKLKRPIMGKIAREFADRIVITSDNPRSEEPQTIIDDILHGIDNSDNVYVEIDRAEAIAFAMQNAELYDTILVAGKGHENYQEVNGKRKPFDDRRVIKEVRL